jgi:hypothetical protein
MSERVTKIWVGVFQPLLRRCFPHETRVRVLTALLEQERDFKPFRVISLDEIESLDFSNYTTRKEAASLLVQILTRSIRNNFSEATAAANLFREHRGGTASGWLPDYLDGLPGLPVDLKRCTEIADANEPSPLREAMADASAESLP